MSVNVYVDERTLIKSVMMDDDIDIFLIETPAEKERNCYEPKKKDVFYNMQAVVLCTAPKFW